MAAPPRPLAKPVRFAVIGATSWGCTLASLLELNGHAVVLICRTPEESAAVDSRRGLERMPGLRLGAGVTTAAPGSADSFDGTVVAVPAQAVRATLQGLGGLDTGPVISASKGIEQGTLSRVTEVIATALVVPPPGVSALSGPTLAHEVAKGLPGAAVVASSAEGQAGWWQDALARPTLRLYRSDDLVGVELAGALKNVVAIAAGATWALGFGANAVAALMTRGLAEITRLGIAMGADALTFQGLAGVGDLAATCFSDLSRNRRLGELLATGHPFSEASRLLGEVAEGAATAPAALELASRHGVELPIAEQVARVVAGQTSVPEAMGALLGRSLKAEHGGA
ncbi:MAG: NAD(P)H-dependent glycerol-3-phosphate dehydrogenase [Dehalococcoidia bacterium]